MRLNDHSFLGVCLLLLLTASVQAQTPSAPNVILIFADDMGYADASSFGAPLIETPHLDQMATDGIRLTDFYVPHSICTPSRAALLTGRYAWRTGSPKVIFPGDNGLNAQEVTIAEAVREVGYTTACIGKWHLGDNPGDLPTTQGFDYYYGIPYSNDMDMGPQIALADDIVLREGVTLQELQNGDYNHPVGGDFPPLMRNNEAIEFPADQSTLTQRYTTEALSFIESANTAGQPFFLYMPHTFPHVPLFRSPDFVGTSAGGKYGDVIEELDWSVGQVKAKLAELGITNNTLIIFTSDNGPWLSKGADAGSADPLRGGKFDLYDGGTRVPFFAQWPGQIPAGTVSGNPAMTIDLLPTIALLAGAAEHIPDDVTIDGRNIWNVLSNSGSRSWDQFYFSQNNNNNFKATRNGVYKALFNNNITSVNELYDLSNDIDESDNLVSSNPTVAADILKDAQAFNRQNEVALAGVSPYSYYGQSGDGVTLNLLALSQSYLKNQFTATISDAPMELQGSVLLQYADSDKGFAETEFIVVTSISEGTAIVAYDANATQLPAWLSSWTPSGETITVNYGGQPAVLTVYTKSFGAGDLIIFGGNAEGGGDGTVPYLAALDVPTEGVQPVVQEPYNGTPLPIPGQIEIEEYDVGGAGVAYLDSDPAQEGNASFRTDEGVDLSNAQDVGGGFNLAFTAPGEWIEFTVDVAETGLYDIEVRGASPFDGKGFSLEFNGQGVTGPITVPNTGDYQTWMSIIVEDVPLQAGTQIMRFVSNTNQYNLNFLNFTAAVQEPLEVGDVLYRINAGAGTLAATDAPKPDWSEDSAGSPSQYVNAAATGNKTNSVTDAIAYDPSVPAYVPEALFQTERFSQNTNPVIPLEWDLPVTEEMQVIVNLYFAEIFRTDNDRFFDVEVEGELQLNDYSIHAEVGPDVGVLQTFTVNVTDANLDINLIPVGLLPKISGIEILYNGEPGPIDPDPDVTAPVITISGDNPAQVIVGTTYTDAGATALDNIDPTVSVEATGTVDVNTIGTYEITYSATDQAGNSATAVRTVNVIADPNVLPGDVLYRVNAGEVLLTATDAPNPDWEGDTEANPSPYLNPNLPYSASTFTNTITRTITVPDYVPTDLFNSERFSSLQADPTPVLEWNFPITNPTKVEVRLYFAEVFRDDADRIFDVEIEGILQLDDYSIFGEVGKNVAIMKIFTVDVTDGNLDLDFVPVNLLPKVSGIEIVKVEDLGTPMVELQGSIQLEGRSDYSTTATVSLYEVGTNQLVAEYPDVSTNITGAFTISDLAEGTYDVYVKATSHLATKQTVTMAAGNNQVDFGEQAAGDTNQDNEISLLDFSLLAGSYNLSLGDEGYVEGADFTGDGVVNIFDFSLLAINYLESGATPPTP